MYYSFLLSKSIYTVLQNYCYIYSHPFFTPFINISVSISTTSSFSWDTSERLLKLTTTTWGFLVLLWLYHILSSFKVSKCLSTGVPLGSVHGPLLFALYTTSLVIYSITRQQYLSPQPGYPTISVFFCSLSL